MEEKNIQCRFELWQEYTLNKYKLGDRVQLVVDSATLQDLQPGHGDYTPEMAEFVGKIGRVHRITSGGDVRVIFEKEGDKKWTLHPAAIVQVLPRCENIQRTFEKQQAYLDSIDAVA